MHTQQIRKYAPALWQSLLRIAPIAALIAVGWSWSAYARAQTPVVTQVVSASEFYEATRAYAGTTMATRAAKLGFKHSGALAELLVDLGDTVREGEVLARLDTRDLGAAVHQAEADVGLAKANVRAADAQARLAAQTERRIRNLHAKGHVSTQQLDEQRLTLDAERAKVGVARAALRAADARLAAAKANLDQATLYAPFDGVVQTLAYDIGAQIPPGQTVLRVVERGTIEAHVGLPDRMATQLTMASTFTAAWSGQFFPANLRAVLPEVDPTTRTVTGVFEIADATIPVGAVIELKLGSRIAERGFWVPVAALAEADRGLWGVYVIAEDGTADRRLVEIIHHESEQAYVRGTLSDGETIIASGVQRIVPGQAVIPVARTSQRG